MSLSQKALEEKHIKKDTKRHTEYSTIERKYAPELKCWPHYKTRSLPS